MNSYSRSRDDVRVWPAGVSARKALESFFTEMSMHQQFVPELVANGLDFTGADLSGMELAGADWVSANLTDVRLRDASLTGAWLLDANLTRADLTRSNLREALLRGCSGVNCTLVGSQLNKADLSGSDLRLAVITDTDLTQVFLPEADLRGADLRGSSWGSHPKNAFMKAARLGGAHVENMAGDVSRPIDVGVHEPRFIAGEELQRWFVDNGAPAVRWNPGKRLGG